MILSVEKQWEGETASDDARGGGFQQDFQVIVDRPDAEDGLSVLKARGIPRRGMGLPGNSKLVASSPTARRVAPCVFVVSVGYVAAERAGIIGTLTPGAKPWDYPEEWEISWAVSMEARDRTWAGDPIANSAGEPFDNPVQEEQSDVVLVCRRNELKARLDDLDVCSRCTNAKQFLAFAPGKCRIRGGGRVIYNPTGPDYWAMSYEIRVRNDGWKHRRLDAGYRELTGASDSQGRPISQAIVDVNGQPITAPVKLDGKGQRLKTGAKDVWLQIETLGKADFNIFKLNGYPYSMMR